ncbi:MAG: hypothetical protein KDK36_02320 [Leptospiraceae bacterium]|nr:hypothetical protein [Leptospiraceae bacterium]
MNENSINNQKIDPLIPFIAGLVLLIILLVTIFFIKDPSPFQYLVFRVIIALSAAGLAALLPGFLSVETKGGIKAGGALGVFVIVYFFSPAELMLNNKSDKAHKNHPDSQNSMPPLKNEPKLNFIPGVYESLIIKYYELVSNYNQLDSNPNLKNEVLENSIKIAEQFANFDRTQFSNSEKIDSSYYIMTLYFYAANLTENEKEKRKYIYYSLKYIRKGKNGISSSIQMSKKGDPVNQKLFQWVIEESLREKFIFYEALNFCMLKIMGEDVDLKEIDDLMDSIPSQYKLKYRLDENPLLIEVRKEGKEIIEEEKL